MLKLIGKELLNVLGLVVVALVMVYLLLGAGADHYQMVKHCEQNHTLYKE